MKHICGSIITSGTNSKHNLTTRRSETVKLVRYFLLFEIFTGRMLYFSDYFFWANRGINNNDGQAQYQAV